MANTLMSSGDTLADILQSTWGAPIIGIIAGALAIWLLCTDPFR